MLIAGNWKMFKTPSEAKTFCRSLRESIGDVEGIDIAVCPPARAHAWSHDGLAVGSADRRVTRSFGHTDGSP